MDWKTVGKAVKKFAPILGLAMGPAGSAAGGVISLVASAFGIEDEDPTPDMIMAAINADPTEAALKLRTVQEENKVELARIALQGDSAIIIDKQNARSREIEITKTTGKRDINLYILAYMFIAGFFIATILVSYFIMTGQMPAEIPQAAVFLIGNLFGTLSAGVGAILQYFFGSSKSSADKTEMLGKINGNR